MKWPKRIFKATWLVFGAGQILLLCLYWFNVGMVPQLLWWQLLTPALWLAFWTVLWLLVALWHSFLESGRRGSIKRDKANLHRYRLALYRCTDKAGPKAREYRRLIREIEERMKQRAQEQSGIREE